MKQHLPNPDKFSQGFYIPENPQKYQGKMPIRCLSSWEFKVCKMFDLNDNILSWSSESVAITYYHPFKQKLATYYPDYMIAYVDKFGKRHKEIVEVKPFRQTVMEAARSKKEKADVVLNTYKFEAAKAFCQERGITFRVLTEKQIFAGRK